MSTRRSALYIEHGETVRFPDGTTRRIASAHYAGPVDGTGTTTLIFADGTQWQGWATTPLHVVTS